MKTDKELLEAAAKAAGIQHAMCWEAAPENGEPFAYASLAKGFYWRPLGDDGDALRLAVKLRLSISIDDRPAGVVRVYVPSDSVPPTDEPTGGDLAAATRRAIVRAAAAMAT